MNGKRAIKKSAANHPVKKSIRLLKTKINKLTYCEHLVCINRQDWEKSSND